MPLPLIHSGVPLNRPVAVFDLDGCLVCSASPVEVTDHDFWFRVWTNPDHPCNNEMIELAKTLIQADWHIAILTARPERYREVTSEWLQRVVGDGIPLPPVNISLTMFTEKAGKLGLNSAQFKTSIIGGWQDAGVRVLFMVEDYKPVAEAVRQYVPVLLYEQIRRHR